MKTALLSLPAGALGGNRTTALRWARILRQLGWDVIRAAKREVEQADLILGLHAVHTLTEVERLQTRHPLAKLIVACTGTDIYESLDNSQVLLDRADKIIVLQERALEELTADQREKARVIYQSTPQLDPHPASPSDHLRVALIANLRDVKDPLLPAKAARLLPESSRIKIIHLGAPIEAALAAAAERESEENPRYEWRGHASRLESLRLLASAHTAVLSSKSEGGANLITEAFAMGTAVIATDIPGNLGLLGGDHPGLFPVGDTEALAALLTRLEVEETFLDELSRRSRERAWLATPAQELESWESLIAAL